MKAMLNDTDDYEVVGFDAETDEVEFGEHYMARETCRVGANGVTEILYHAPLGDGDQHYLDVYVDHKLYERVFSFTAIQFKGKEKTEC